MGAYQGAAGHFQRWGAVKNGESKAPAHSEGTDSARLGLAGA